MESGEVLEIILDHKPAVMYQEVWRMKNIKSITNK
jgi:uncharacterized protein (DUF2249 family)